MVRKFWGKKPFFGKRPDDKKNVQEFGPGKDDIIMCSECNAVYYHKNWYHNLRNYDNLSEDKSIKFKVCPADLMKKEGKFEGQVVIQNYPSEIKTELKQLIKNIGERAYERDVLDRVLEIKDTSKNEIEVRTSENQLAISIGKQVHKAHKKSDIEIKLSEDEDVARVRVWWEQQ